MDHAIEKRHATINEAVDACMKMNAYRIVLTHFSQRYPKLPVFSSASAARVIVAFDYMHVDFADLPHLPGALPALVQLFADEEDDDDELGE